MSTWIYAFGDGVADGRAAMRDLLGGKGANLAEMANLGMPVPPGFTITTEVCAAFPASDSRYPDDLAGAVEERPVTIRLLDPPLHEFLPQSVRARHSRSRAAPIPPRRFKVRT